MNQTLAEMLILTTITLGAGLLLFISTTMQKVMESMSAANFKGIITKLFTFSARDPLSILESILPFVGGVGYFIAYGFGHLWFSVGFVVWLIASIVSKLWNVPIYQSVIATDSKNSEKLEMLRRKLRYANVVRATLTSCAVVLMLVQFVH